MRDGSSDSSESLPCTPNRPSVRKLDVTDRHRAMVTEIVLIVITEIVTAVDVIGVADPDPDGGGNVSLLRTMIPLMTVMTVTGLVVVVHRNLTGQSR